MGSGHSSRTAHRRLSPPTRTWCTVLASLLALAACGDDGGNGAAGAGESAPCGGETTAADQIGGGGPSSDATPDRSAILRWGTMRAESLDPIREGSTVDYVQLNAIFDTLLTVSPEDGSIEGRLATEWEADEERISLTLREDVVFQDGTDFDAEAVEVNLDRAMNDSDSTISGLLDAVDEVEVVDTYEVDILLAEPTPLAVLQQLTDRPGMMASPEALDDAGDSTAFSEEPVGAGMYRVEGEWFPRESLSVLAWDDYWDTEAQLLGGIDFTDLDPAARVNALLADDIDVVSTDGLEVSELESSSSVALSVGAADMGRGLTVNPTLEPFDDPLVRQAIAHAINREAVVEALTNGYGEARCQPFSADSPAHVAELDELYTYDPDRARELLEEAGYDDGLEFHAIIGSGATDYVNFGELLQAQLAEVGITMDLELVDRSRAIPMLYEEEASGAAPIGVGANARLTDQVIRNYFLEDGAFNAGDVELPEVRELMEEVGGQPDVDSARPYYQDINRAVTEDLFQVIPVYADAAILGHQADVGGLTPGLIDVDPSPELLRGVYIADE